MIGALIGDLAAWTYEHDGDTFWKQLIPDKGGNAVPSVYGHALMRAASKNVLSVPEQDVSFIRTGSERTPKEALCLAGQWLMWQLTCAWFDDRDYPEGMQDDIAFEKEEGYARMFVIDLVRALRAGQTKSEAFHSVHAFEWLIKGWNWRPWLKSDGGGGEYSLLTHLFRAWDSFYRGFDFTSSIHNAMKWGGDRRLIASLTGAFADAMYGSEQSFIRKKYAKDGGVFHYNEILALGEWYGYHYALIHEMAHVSFYRRSFFPKNSALTNVERHIWQDCPNEFYGYNFTEREKCRILRAGRTGWENRYGTYLDDGWLYCYRSYTLLLRFKLQYHKEHRAYKIVNVQLSGEHSLNESVSGLRNALCETCEVALNKQLL